MKFWFTGSVWTLIQLHGDVPSLWHTRMLTRWKYRLDEHALAILFLYTIARYRIGLTPIYYEIGGKARFLLGCLKFYSCILYVYLYVHRSHGPLISACTGLHSRCRKDHQSSIYVLQELSQICNVHILCNFIRHPTMSYPFASWISSEISDTLRSTSSAVFHVTDHIMVFIIIIHHVSFVHI